MVAESSDTKPAIRNTVAPLRPRTPVPGQAPELLITPNKTPYRFTCGRKRYLLPTAGLTVLPLINTTLEALAG
jgi:hypothetical protein